MALAAATAEDACAPAIRLRAADRRSARPGRRVGPVLAVIGASLTVHGAAIVLVLVARPDPAPDPPRPIPIEWLAAMPSPAPASATAISLGAHFNLEIAAPEAPALPRRPLPEAPPLETSPRVPLQGAVRTPASPEVSAGLLARAWDTLCRLGPPSDEGAAALLPECPESVRKTAPPDRDEVFTAEARIARSQLRWQMYKRGFVPPPWAPPGIDPYDPGKGFQDGFDLMGWTNPIPRARTEAQIELGPYAR